MSKRSAFSQQERDDLIAYLDGELDGEAARALEAKLALDPAARAEADTLKRTYDLLDFLPKAEPSPNFTNLTLSKIGPVRPTGSQTASRRSGESLAGFTMGPAVPVFFAAAICSTPAPWQRSQVTPAWRNGGIG